MPDLPPEEPTPKPTLLKRGPLQSLHRDSRGATSLEWVLLLAAVALPSYFIIRLGFDALIAHYEMAVTLNEIPFP